MPKSPDVIWEPIELDPSPAPRHGRTNPLDTVQFEPLDDEDEVNIFDKMTPRIEQILNDLVDGLIVPGGANMRATTLPGSTLIPGDNPSSFKEKRSAPSKAYSGATRQEHSLMQPGTMAMRESAALLADPEPGNNAYESQDRCFFAYGKRRGQYILDAFALADGVSKSFLGGETAEVYTRLMSAALAELTTARMVLTKEIAAVLCRAIGRRIARENTREQLAAYRVKKVEKIQASPDFKKSSEDIRTETINADPMSLGATTLFAGQVSERQGGGRKIRFLHQGDAAYVILRRTGTVEVREGKQGYVPPQLNWGENSMLGLLHYGEILLDPGDLVCVATDGLAPDMIQKMFAEHSAFLLSEKGKDLAACAAWLLMAQADPRLGYTPSAAFPGENPLKPIDDRSLVLLRG